MNALVETSDQTASSQNIDEHTMNSSDVNGPNQLLQHSLLTSLSQDIFTLITTFLPLSILPLLGSVNHSINQAARHPHCYSRYVHSIQSLDELERLAQMYPSVRSFQCDGTVFRSSNQSVATCVQKLTQLFPHLMSLSISNFTLTDSYSLAQLISVLRLSCLSFESLLCTTEDINMLITVIHPSLQELSLLDMTVDYSTCQLISQLRLRKLNISRCPLIDDECFRVLLGIDQAINISINSNRLIEYVLDHLDDVDDDLCLLPTSQSSLSRSVSLASPLQLSARSLDHSGSITPTNNLAIRRAVSTPSLQSLLRPVNQIVNQTNNFFRDWSPLSQHMRTIVTHHQSNSRSSIETSDDDDHSPFSCHSATQNCLNQLVKSHKPSNLAQSINQLIVSHDRQLTDLSCIYLAFAHLSNIQTHKQHCLCDTDVNHLHPQTMDESFLSYMLDLIDAPPFYQPIDQAINTCFSFPLQHIDLSYVANLTDQSIDLITHLPHVQSLSLSNNQLLTDHSILTISQCHWLLHLALGGLTFSEQGLLSLNQLTNLQSIKLSRLNGPSVSMPITQSLVRNEQRTSYQSSNLGLTDRVVFGLVQLPHLSHMSIKQCENITDATARSIYQAVSISTLIIAQSNRLTALGFRLLGRAPMLKVLSVRGCRGFDQSVKQEIQARRPGLLID